MQYKRRRSYLDLSKEDIDRFPEEIRKWLDPEYLAKRMEFDDFATTLSHTTFLKKFSRIASLSGHEPKPIGCGDPMSAVSFNGWDDRFASFVSYF